MTNTSFSKRFLLWTLASVALMISGPVIAQSADELAKAARAAARTDRNHESAELFERAITASPARRNEWLREYADQLTYSGRAAQATLLYREYLSGQVAPAERQQGLRGLALALSWSDQNDAARAIYEELLAEDPHNTETQRNLGRTISWSGRQRAAQTYLRDFLTQHPNDSEGRFLLAQVQWWLGRPDSALATLVDLNSGSASGNDQSLGLQRDIDQAIAQEARFDQRRSTQSDNLDIAAESIEHRWTSANGLTMIAPWVQHIRYSPRGDNHGVTDQRTGARVRHRFSDDLEINADAASDLIQPSGFPSYTRLTYSSWLTWWPNDELRFDVSTNRATFDNVLSLQRGIDAHSNGVSLDWTPSERDRVSTRFSHADYSDGNQRKFAQIEMERRILTRPTVWGGLRCTHFDFARQFDNGYFNPINFNACLLTLRADGQSQDADARLSWRAQLASGREHAHPDGDKPVYEIGASAIYRLARNTNIEARWQRFSSRTNSASGFARTTLGIALVYNWGAP